MDDDATRSTDDGGSTPRPRRALMSRAAAVPFAVWLLVIGSILLARGQARGTVFVVVGAVMLGLTAWAWKDRAMSPTPVEGGGFAVYFDRRLLATLTAGPLAFMVLEVDTLILHPPGLAGALVAASLLAVLVVFAVLYVRLAWSNAPALVVGDERLVVTSPFAGRLDLSWDEIQRVSIAQWPRGSSVLLAVFPIVSASLVPRLPWLLRRKALRAARRGKPLITLALSILLVSEDDLASLLEEGSHGRFEMSPPARAKRRRRPNVPQR